MSQDGVREQKYKCSQCGAEDTVKLYQAERTPPAINCWKCKAGFKMSQQDMMVSHTGMFPVVEG